MEKIKAEYAIKAECAINDIDSQIEEIRTKIKDPKLCDGTASTFTRVTGYYRSVEYFNDGKQAEFMQRLEYKLN
jgi:anaerobic ribonucleoside-triphosphate reductase